MRKSDHFRAVTVLILLFAVGCRGKVESTSTIDDVLRTPSSTFTTAPLTTTPLSTATIFPVHEQATVTQAPSDVVFPAFTLTPTPILPTWTPLPTLSPEDAQTTVIELLKNNAGCELPCWWGILPGETPWQSAQHFLASFADRIGQGVPSTSVKDGVELSHLNYAVHFEVPGYPEGVGSGYRITNGIIDMIVVAEWGTELRYQLHQLLTLYGTPEEVLIEALLETNAGKPWFTLILFYPERGIVAYYSHAAQSHGGNVRICPTGIGPELTLIQPNSLSLYIMERLLLDSPQVWISLNKVPGMRIDTFYDGMKSPGSCFDVDPSQMK